MKTMGELKRDYKSAPPPMGVLVIRNRARNRFQVRATRNLQGAMNRVRFELTHPSGTFLESELLGDWRSLGPGAFEIEVLDVLEPKDVPGWDPASDLEELGDMWHARLVDAGATPY